MTTLFYKRYLILVFVATLLLFLLLPWNFPFTLVLWFNFFMNLMRMRVHAFSSTHVTTHTGLILTKDSTFKEKFNSFKVDLFLDIFLLVAMALALSGFDEPSLLQLAMPD